MNQPLHDITSLRTTLTAMLARELRMPASEVQGDLPLLQYGLDSISALTISGDLEELFDIELNSTLLWDCPTLDHLALFLEDTLRARNLAAA
jgi:acyl carrier protein